jgi:hypothetical protein
MMSNLAATFHGPQISPKLCHMEAIASLCVVRKNEFSPSERQTAKAQSPTPVDALEKKFFFTSVAIVGVILYYIIFKAQSFFLFNENKFSFFVCVC